jgi:competence ComEA-like helix-hairpin-helix protein
MRQKLSQFLLIIFCCLLFGCGQAEQVLPEKSQATVSKSAVNINTASARELEKLPNIGEKLAVKIVEHREKFGNFRKPEHLMLVRGISDRRFRAMRSSVKVEN